jgi:RNA polymerase sigma-70 factor, ECF subfamily
VTSTDREAGAVLAKAGQVSDAWAQHRPYLVGLAFRMLGDIGEAEDTVQEAFARLMATDVADIADARGWLTVVTSRLCLDQIRSSRWRLQHPHDLDAIESRLPGVGSSFVDPAERVTLDDNVRLALCVVLDRLTPAERVVFVLHDIFQVPFETVADTVGRTAQACRQLARRARAKIDDAARGVDIGLSSAEHRLVTQRFVEACASGDLSGLLHVLDPAVSGWADILPDVVTHGADAVAGNFLLFWGAPARLVALTTGRSPVLLGFVDRELRAVIELTISHQRITEVHVRVRPPIAQDFLA